MLAGLYAFPVYCLNEGWALEIPYLLRCVFMANLARRTLIKTP